MTEPSCVVFSFSSSVNVSHAGEYVHEAVLGKLSTKTTDLEFQEDKSVLKAESNQLENQ